MIDLPALSLAMCQMYIHAFFQKAFALLQSFEKSPFSNERILQVARKIAL